MKISQILLLACIVIAAGCDSGGVMRPAPTRVKVFNAAANIESTVFLREEKSLSDNALNYNDGIDTAFDSGEYDFHVEYRPLGSPANVRTDTISATLAPDRNYTFVIVAPTGEPELISTATDAVDADFSDTRITLIHAFPGLGDVDVYLEPAGTDLTTATPRGTMSYGPNALTSVIAPDAYRVFLTTAGDPTDVVFESVSQPPDPGLDQVLVVSDPGNGGTLSILVSQISLNTGRLGQIGQESRLRVIQGVDDKLARDIYLDDTTTAALFPAQPFGVLSAYTNIAIDYHEIVTTPLSNPGTEESTITYFAVPGQLFTAVIAGDSVDGVTTHIVNEDKRSISGQATVRIYNAASQFDSVATYIEEPGTDVTPINPLVNMVAPSSTFRIPLLPDDYEITIENLDTSTILAGPLPVTMDDGGVYGILLIDGPSADTVDIVLFDDFNP